MKKIVLAGINARFSHPALALYSLRSYVSAPDIEVKIMEFTISQENSQILDAIAREKPWIAGFSVYIWNVEKIRHMLMNIREKLGDCMVLLGGPEVTYDPASWTGEYDSIGCIIAGPGEEALRRLIREEGFPADKIIRGKNPHFSRIPFPYREDDFVALRNRNVYYEASRGCPFQCSYCVSSRRDQKPEFRTLETAMEEIDIIASHRPGMVKFLDRTFNLKKDFSRGLWEHIMKAWGGSGIRFHFEIFPGLLDEDDYSLLSRAPRGLFQFEVGIQSTCRETLAAIGRDGEWEDIRRSVERLVSPGNIRIHADLVAGLPYEDISSMKRSFDGVYGLKCGHFQLGMLKVLKGTRLHEEAPELGIEFSPAAPYMIRRTGWLSEEEVERLGLISRLVDLLYNSHKFPATLEALEKLQGSYYDLYDSLVAFIHGRYPGMGDGAWEVHAGWILDFITSRRPGEKEYFRDLLAWDWGLRTRHNYPPEVVKQGDRKAAKKRAIKFFMGHSRGGTVFFGGHEFPAGELKRSIFISPATERFMKEKLGGNAMALIRPGKEVVLFTP